MIHIRLPEAEAQELDAAFRPTEDRKLRDRPQVVLLDHRGRKRQAIAADLRIDRRSVQRRLNAYRERGRAGLAPPEGQGQGLPSPR
jgi:transposase